MLAESGNIVVVGSSTGGLRILDQLFDNLPSLRTSIVIVHKMAWTPNLVVDRLDKKTEMQVLLAENGMKLRDACVYVAPTCLHLRLMSNTTIELFHEDCKRHCRGPVDTSMRSLNPDDWVWIVGIVLSGVGQDGAEGIRHVKSIGGVTIAQEPTSTPLNSMPKAACHTGCVDLVLTPERIKMALIGLFGDVLAEYRSIKESSSLG